MYYYIDYTITSKVTGHVNKTNCVTDKHPFDWLKWYDGFSGKWDLLDWKEIDKAEYDKGVLAVGIG